MTFLNRKQQGLGFLELILSIAIIVIILIMATRYYILASTAEKMKAAVTEVNIVTTALQQWQTKQPNFKNITLEKLAAQGLLPNKYYHPAEKKLVGPWGRNLNFTVHNDGAYISITFTLISAKHALNLAKKLPKATAEANKVTVKIYPTKQSS
jgi:competence protein ComGC